MQTQEPPTQFTYRYRYTPEKKLTPTMTRQATITVMDINGKIIGQEHCSKWEKPEDIAQMIIREHQNKKHFNTKEYRLWSL